MVLSVFLAVILDFALQREMHKDDYRGTFSMFSRQGSGANIQNLFSPLFVLSPIFSDLCQILSEFYWTKV